jgi:hypothetical protein
MSKTAYRRCSVDWAYHHPDETILLPEGADRDHQKRFCLDHALEYLRGKITDADLLVRPRGKKAAA